MITQLDYGTCVKLLQETIEIKQQGSLTVIEKRIPDSSQLGELDPRVYQVD